MDGPSRARVLVGVFAVIVAVLASLALLNVLLAEPVPLGDGSGDDGGDRGGSSLQPTPGDDGGDGDGGGGGQRNDPCDPLEPVTRTIAIVVSLLAMLLWVVAVWWRQKKATRVMNGWAIAALLVTLVAVTLLFAWWIIHKICTLDIRDLKSCLELAHSMRNSFFIFLLLGGGLIGYSIYRMRKGNKFWGIWSIGGFVFVYLTMLALVGWLVTADLCERTFELDEDRLPDDGGDGGDGDGDGGDGGGDGGDGGSDGGDDGGGGSGGGDPGFGGGRGGGTSTGGGGAPSIPEVSPFALLIVLGVAALITILVLAVKGRQEQIRQAAMAAAEMDGRAGLLRLFMDTDLESNDNVVAAYRKMLDHAMLHGVPKKAQETPREHARRAADKLDVAYEEMLPLVDAYSQVRLGDRPLPDDRRKAALLLQRIFRPRTVAAKSRKGDD